MFKIVERPEFTHEVKVQMPVDGGFHVETFRARFRLLPTSEVEDMQTRTAEEIADFLRVVIVSLSDLADAAGQPLTYNDALRDAVLDLQPCRMALYRTYFAAVTKGPAGN